jgi:anti-sigma factor RsiW
MKPHGPHELISAYFDGEVMPDERAAVERLLSESEDARGELNEISKLSALLHSFPREFAPAELAQNIERETNRKALPEPSPARTFASRSRLRDFKVALASGLSAACLVLAMVAWNPFVGGEKFPIHVAELKKAPKDHLAQVDAKSVAGSQSQLQPQDSSSAASRVAAKQLAAADGVGMNSDGVAMKRSQVKLEAGNLPNAGERATSSAEDVAQAELSKSEFLNHLRIGNLVEMRLVDPAKNIAVVEFTVADVDQAEGQLHALLVRNAIVPWTGDEKTKAEISEKAKGKKDPEMVLVYTVATGEQLANTFFDVSKHPDLFRDWSYQQPVSLGSTMADASSATAANRKPVAKQSQTNDRDELASANAEAEQAANTFIERALNVSTVVADKSVDATEKSTGNTAQSSLAARPKGYAASGMIGNSGSPVVQVSPPTATQKNEMYGNSLTFRRQAPDGLANSVNNPANPANSAFGNSAVSQNPMENSAIQQRLQQAQISNESTIRNEASNRVKMLWVLHPAQDSPVAPSSKPAQD